MKISSIKQQLKYPERASVFVDGKYSFSLSLNELVAERLKINQEISDLDLIRLIKLSVDGKLKSRTLDWVMNRPRSQRELRDYLFRKKAEPEQITGITEEFKIRGYVNDKKFAVWLIDLRKRGGKSTRSIQNELMRKGVDRETIASSLPKDKELEIEQLKNLIAKKLRISRYAADEVKLKQYLLRQGFSYEDIKSAMTIENET